MSGTHVTKLIGSPGSGKTTRLLEFAETEAEEYGTGYGELLFLTYSKSARYEATERIRDVYPNTDEEELEKRVRTVHSAALVACLVDGPLDLRDRGAPDDDGKLIIMEQEGKGLELFEFFFDSKRNCPSIRYDADTDDPIQQLEQGGASEIPLGNKLIAAYNYVRTKDWEFSDYWQTPFDLDLSESEVIEAFEKWEAFKERHDLIQHHDYQKMALDGGYAPETDVLIIDEFQDLSPLQIKLYEMWRDSGRIKRMYIAGDPHQCIPEGTPVQTPEGTVPIESIDTGDSVISAYTDGETTTCEVTSTHSRETIEPIAKFQTESGAEVSCTLDHELFACLPNQHQSDALGDDNKTNFVYIMKSNAGDYRVGITTMPRKRFSVEGGAAAMMIISAHTTQERALIEEKKIAYQYSIPQTPFKERDGLSQGALEELYDAVNTEDGFEKLCANRHLDPDRFHLVAQTDGTAESQYQISGDRVAVNLRMGRVRSRANGDYVYHTVVAQSSTEKAKAVLGKTALSESSSSSDESARFRKQTGDYQEARIIAENTVQDLKNADIEASLTEKAVYGSFDESCGRRVPLNVLFAGQITEGMYIPVTTDGDITYERVVEKEVQQQSTAVHDLTVEPTHNFVVGDQGVIVHNCIYSFRGAEPMYFRREGVDEVVHHEKSWRCPSAVIDAAVPVAEPVPEHDVSRVSARTDGGSVEHVDADGPLDLSRMVFDALDEHEQIYLLARTNRQAGKIAYGLREGGVPYLDLKPHGPLRRWKQPLPMILSAIQAIDNGQHLPLPIATALLENLSPAPPRREAQQRAEDGHLSPTSRIRGHVITPGEYREWFPDVDRGRELVPQLSVKDWRRDLVEGALRSGADHHPENVRVGTIHAAKGLESPRVMLFPAYTHKQMERFENGDEAEERRLFYVAMTRASDRLDVVHSYFGGKEFPPLSAV